MTSLRHLEGWKLRGLCATHPDPDLWFANDPNPAKAVCARCPVRATCLTDALARGEAFGVLGGLTGAERRRAAADGGFSRPSPAGAAQHGQRSSYNAGCHCGPCTDANARYVSGWRRSRSWSVTRRDGLFVAVLEVPAGHGRRRAFPGQLYISIGAAA